LCSAPPSPANSPKKLDWGSIDDEDGAYALHLSLLEAAAGASASPARAAGSLLTAPAPAPPHGVSSPGGQGQAALKERLSPSRSLRPGDHRAEAPLKLKSVMVVPNRLNGATHDERLHDDEQTQCNDLSQEWQPVKPKRGTRAAGQTSSAGAFTRSPHPAPPTRSARPLPLEYKKMFQGKCFKCLARDNQVAHCHDPPRCVNCFQSGHFARHCRAPTSSLRRSSVHSRLIFPKPSIRSRLVFPPDSIHSRITFSELTAAEP
jgi:hypothetical protein